MGCHDLAPILRQSGEFDGITITLRHQMQRLTRNRRAEPAE